MYIFATLSSKYSGLWRSSALRDRYSVSLEGLLRLDSTHFKGHELLSSTSDQYTKEVNQPTSGTTEIVWLKSIRRLGHRPGLDGLRGVAWLAVFVGHVQPFNSISPADTGMFIFFALSGFLITQLIIEERDRYGKVSLISFFKRRIARLLPALVVFLSIWFVVVALFSGSPWLSTVPQGGPAQHVGINAAAEGVIASLSYLINWVEMSKLFTSYVPIGHIWSLAVEMQFYVIWAIALKVFLRRSKRLALLVALAGSLISCCEAIYLMRTGVSGLRIYMGTDVRAGALLAGSAAALIWSTRSFKLIDSKMFGVLSGLSLAVLIWSMFAFKDPTLSVSQQLAWPLTAIASAFVVIYLVEGAGKKIVKWMCGPVITYLGRRSYALYLWHYVWLTWLRSFGFIGVISAFIMSIITAELSWRFIERPAARWVKGLSLKRKNNSVESKTGELQLLR